MAPPKIWSIYYIVHCIHAIPKPKPKYAAIVCKDKEYWGFLVNTSVREFIKSSPLLSSLQVKIQQSEYPFLKHDSYINCAQIFPFDSYLLTSFEQNIIEHTKIKIKSILPNAKTIPKHYIDLITS